MIAITGEDDALCERQRSEPLRDASHVVVGEGLQRERLPIARLLGRHCDQMQVPSRRYVQTIIHLVASVDRESSAARVRSMTAARATLASR